MFEFQVEPTWSSFTVMVEGTCGSVSLTRESDEDLEEEEEEEERGSSKDAEEQEERESLAKECEQLRLQWIEENSAATDLEVNVKMVRWGAGTCRLIGPHKLDRARSRQGRRALRRLLDCLS